jgi:hypothetical protein
MYDPRVDKLPVVSCLPYLYRDWGGRTRAVCLYVSIAFLPSTLCLRGLFQLQYVHEGSP